MVDFSFIVSLYVSDLPNVTVSTRTIVSLYVSDLFNVTKSTREDSCLRATSPCDRRTNERTNTQLRFVKSGGYTDNAKKTTQDMQR